MALRNPMTGLFRQVAPPCKSRVMNAHNRHALLHRSMATVAPESTIVPPVTQSATSSKGPTAMVFMNMGGPATTDEVGSFLSRLFVRASEAHIHAVRLLTCVTGGRRLDTSRPPPRLSWTPDISSSNSQDPKTVCRHRGRIADPQMVRISVRRNVQDLRHHITRNRPPQAIRGLSICRSINRRDVH